jgi:hypothetical protein
VAAAGVLAGCAGEPVRRFDVRCGLLVTRDAKDPRDIAPNLRTAVLDPHGRLAKIFAGYEWTPAEVLQAIEAALATS